MEMPLPFGFKCHLCMGEGAGWRVSVSIMEFLQFHYQFLY